MDVGHSGRTVVIGIHGPDGSPNAGQYGGVSGLLPGSVATATAARADVPSAGEDRR